MCLTPSAEFYARRSASWRRPGRHHLTASERAIEDEKPALRPRRQPSSSGFPAVGGSGMTIVRRRIRSVVPSPSGSTAGSVFRSGGKRALSPATASSVHLPGRRIVPTEAGQHCKRYRLLRWQARNAIRCAIRRRAGLQRHGDSRRSASGTGAGAAQRRAASSVYAGYRANSGRSRM